MASNRGISRLWTVRMTSVDDVHAARVAMGWGFVVGLALGLALGWWLL